MQLNVAVLGASNKIDRYSNKAIKKLVAAGHRVFPVSIDGKTIDGITGYKSLVDIPESIDTVTVYVNPERLDNLLSDIIALGPRRAIFNPDTGTDRHTYKLLDAGIHVVEACTLVLLATNQFDFV